MLGINWTINALVMTTVGGLGTVLGPLIGAVAVYYLLTKQLESYQTLSVIIEGTLLLAIVRFAPRGLWPLLTTVLTRAAGRRSRIARTRRGADQVPESAAASASPDSP